MLAATPGQLVVMLYDGARPLPAPGRRRDARRRDRARAQRPCATRERIIGHLDGTLDFEQGELPQRLHAIYLFCLSHLNAARMGQDPAKVEEVSELLGELRDAWSQVAAEVEHG